MELLTVASQNGRKVSAVFNLFFKKMHLTGRPVQEGVPRAVIR